MSNLPNFFDKASAVLLPFLALSSSKLKGYLFTVFTAATRSVSGARSLNKAGIWSQVDEVGNFRQDLDVDYTHIITKLVRLALPHSS